MYGLSFFSVVQLKIVPFGKASVRSRFVLNFQWIAIGDTNKSKLAGLAVVKKWLSSEYLPKVALSR